MESHLSLCSLVTSLNSSEVNATNTCPTLIVIPLETSFVRIHIVLKSLQQVTLRIAMSFSMNPYEINNQLSSTWPSILWKINPYLHQACTRARLHVMGVIDLSFYSAFTVVWAMKAWEVNYEIVSDNPIGDAWLTDLNGYASETGLPRSEDVKSDSSS